MSGPQALAAPLLQGQAQSQALTLSCTPPAAEPELVELARALEYDPDLIYQYVHDNIATLPQYGSLKGPLGAMLDGAGTPFDQAELMFVLLQQSCYTPRYELGQIQLTSAQYTNWLGTDSTFYSVGYALGSGGFPASFYGTYSDVTDVVLGWAWVKVTIDGSDYVFDPSTKTYARSEGLTDLAAALGYSQSALLGDAETGASITGTAISGLNRTALRADLAQYASNLVDTIRSSAPTATTVDIIGGEQIERLPVDTQLRQSTLPMAYGSISDYAAMPSQYRTTLAVAVPGASSVTFNTADIYGHRLSLFFNASIQPVLRLDGVVEATGSAASAGSQVGIGITVTHPYSSTFANQSGTLNVLAGGTYLISNGWGPVGRGMIERHRRLLRENQAAAPGDASAEPVLGESLAMIGYTWLAENARAQHITDRLADTLTDYQHAVGIVGMRTVGSSEGPFVDLPMNLLSLTERHNRSSSTTPTPGRVRRLLRRCQHQQRAGVGHARADPAGRGGGLHHQAPRPLEPVGRDLRHQQQRRQRR